MKTTLKSFYETTNGAKFLFYKFPNVVFEKIGRNLARNTETGAEVQFFLSNGVSVIV